MAKTRKMENVETGTIIDVEQHIITSNFWEFYLTPQEAGQDDSVRFGLVMGDCTELGDVSLAEIGPHVITKAVGRGKLEDVMPAGGWRWQDEDELF